MKRLSKAKIRKAQKAEAKRVRKAEAEHRAENSKARQLVRQYLPTVLGIRIPGFFRIHFRYAKRSFITWCVLFVAPFVISNMSVHMIAENYLDLNPSDVQVFVISFFLIALAFYFAERHRKFRRIYVMFIPALVIAYGVISRLAGLGPIGGSSGRSIGDDVLGSLITFGILSVIPAWWLWKHAADKGYKALSDGADTHYRPGRDLYMDGKYAEAFTHLEPSAKRGHMKSLYLLGHAHENGQGRELDRVTAARLYDKAARKGYTKARHAFDDLFERFSKDEIKQYETDLGTTGVNELF